MIRPIMKDPVFLSQKSAQASPADLPVLNDLMDTLRANGRKTNSICQAIWKLERKDTARPTGERRTICRIR